MTLNAGTVYVDVKPDTSEMTSATGGLSTGMKVAGALAAGAFIASWAAAKVGPFISDSITEASNISESTSKIAKVFGESGDSVMKFAAQAATSLGQSRAEAMESAGVFGNLLRSIGFTEKASAGMSTQMVTLASDLASFNNTTVDEAFTALKAGLVGEAEPLKKFGVSLNDTTLKIRAMKMGLIESTTDALTPAIKSQVAYAEIMRQTKLAQGDFADTSTGLANQQKILGAQFSNIKGIVGKALLPAFSAIMNMVTGGVMPAIKGLAKDAAPLLHKFGNGLQGIAALLLKGDFTKQLGKAFNLQEDSPIVGQLLTIRTRVREFFSDFRKNLQGIDVAEVFRTITEAVKKLGPKLAEASDAGGPLSSTVKVFGVVIRFAAKHVDLLAKALPALIAGYILFKTAQAASNAVAVLSPALKVADMLATRQLARSNAQLTSAILAQNGALISQTTTQGVNTASKSGGLIATLRNTAATVAGKVATLASSAATKAAAAAQWLLNAAMTANPIGLVIAAVVALIAIIVLIIVKVKPVREFLLKVWRVVAAAAVKAWDLIKRGIAVLFGFLKTIVMGYIGVWKAVFSKIYAAVKWYIDKVKGVFKTGWEAIQAVFKGVGEFFGGVFDSALEAAKTVFNAIASAWNSTVGNLSFHAPDWVPGIGGKGWDVPDIPMLAKGGIVNQPTLAMIGEAGPEAVIPLSGGAGGGMSVRIVDSNLGLVMTGVLESDKAYLAGAGRMNR